MDPSNHSFTDPRLLPDFDDELMPLFEGGPVPPIETNSRYEKLVIEFCAVYYQMNVALIRLEHARRTGDSESERRALEALCQASRTRDALEDRCAPEGFYAEPVMDCERYANLCFMWSGKQHQERTQIHRFTAEFSFE